MLREIRLVKVEHLEVEDRYVEGELEEFAKLTFTDKIIVTVPLEQSKELMVGKEYDVSILIKEPAKYTLSEEERARMLAKKG